MSKTRYTAQLEAAAKALYTRQAHMQRQMAVWQSVPHTVKEEYCRWAADVLRAIREPDETMLEAAWASIHDENGAGTWRDMIDALLGEPTHD